MMANNEAATSTTTTTQTDHRLGMTTTEATTTISRTGWKYPGLRKAVDKSIFNFVHAQISKSQ